MNKEELLKFDWIKEKHEGILEIYPRKCGNDFVLNGILRKIQKDYELVKVFDDWIRAFKK